MSFRQLWKTFLKSIFVFAILIVAVFVYADEGVVNAVINNPIKTSTFEGLVKSIAEAVRNVGIPFAITAIIFAGFKLVLASLSGNAQDIESAKKILWWVITGTAIVVGASMLAEIAVNIFKS